MFLAELLTFTIPLFIPFNHYLGRARGHARPPLVARYARLKPLNRSVPLRSTSLAAFNAASQPIRPALRADQKQKEITRQKKKTLQPLIRGLYNRIGVHYHREAKTEASPTVCRATIAVETFLRSPCLLSSQSLVKP